MYVAASAPTLTSTSGNITITGAISTGAVFQFTYTNSGNYLLNGVSTASSSAVRDGLVVTSTGSYGIFSVSTILPLSGIQYLVVGGGGGGSIGCTCYNGGGGGGGGAVVFNSSATLSSLSTGTSYGVSIGIGGTGASGSAVANGGSGGATTLTGLSAGTVAASGGGGSVGGIAPYGSYNWYGSSGSAGNSNSGAGGYGGNNAVNPMQQKIKNTILSNL